MEKHEKTDLEPGSTLEGCLTETPEAPAPEDPSAAPPSPGADRPVAAGCSGSQPPDLPEPTVPPADLPAGPERHEPVDPGAAPAGPEVPLPVSPSPAEEAGNREPPPELPPVIPPPPTPQLLLFPGSLLGGERFTIRHGLPPLARVPAFVAEGPHDRPFVLVVRPHREGWNVSTVRALMGRPGFETLEDAFTDGAADVIAFGVDEPIVERLADSREPADDEALASTLLAQLVTCGSLARAGFDAASVWPDDFAYLGSGRQLCFLGFPAPVVDGGHGGNPDGLRDLILYTAVRVFGRNTTQRLDAGPFEDLPLAVELRRWLQEAHERLAAPMESRDAFLATLGDLEGKLSPLADPRAFVFDAACATDVGMQRQLNEDSVAIFSQDCWFESDRLRYHLLIVCDGMGGHEGGEIASRLTVRTLMRCVEERVNANEPREAARLLKDNAHVRSMLFEAILATNGRVVDLGQTDLYRSRRDKPGSTLCFVFQRGRTAFFGWVGDSRGYLLRGGKLERVTRDHSLNQQRIDRGELTEEEAFNNEDSNVILASIGLATLRHMDVQIQQLQDQDRLILCSDGVCGVLRDREIEEKARSAGTLPDLCARLIEAANDKGGPDNSTVIAAKIDMTRTTGTVA